MAENSGTSNHKVKLVSAANSRRRAIFRATPQVIENRNVNYNALEPLHAPGQIQVYKNTASRNFNISDLKLVSRTQEEADKNLQILWTLRGWCVPRFGNSSTLTTTERRNRATYESARQNGAKESELFFDEWDRRDILGKEILGAPPEVLYFSAYSLGNGSKSNSGDSTTTTRIAQHIHRVPVVIQQLSIPYPNDVDYITTSRGVPMPIIMNLDISLIETHSPNSYEGFSLNDFRRGILRGF